MVALFLFDSLQHSRSLHVHTSSAKLQGFGCRSFVNRYGSSPAAAFMT